jgi:tetratricopeptide (TPR) repeat protein
LESKYIIMEASPAKIKAFLSNIKETLLDNSADDISRLFTALMQLELLQRGVVVTDSLSPIQLLDVVRDTAGKQLLNMASPLPKPLLAGSAVIQGRLAEMLCGLLHDDDASRVLSTLLDSAATLKVIKRCEEVEDIRLKAILKLAFDSNNEPFATIQQRLLYVAEGSYYRATEFQPDIPPMWKRATDSVAERRRVQGKFKSDDTSWEACKALENMQRIAALNGNGRRSAELSLKLAECLLDSQVMSIDEGSKAVVQSFVAPYRSVEPLNGVESARAASKCLKDPNIQLAEFTMEEKLQKSTIELQIQFTHESAVVLQTGNDDYHAARNRSQTRIDTAIEFRRVARQRYLASTDDKDVDRGAVRIRDILLNMDRNKENSAVIESACGLLKLYLLRWSDRAQAVVNAKTKACEPHYIWTTCAEFIEPLVDFYQTNHCVNDPPDADSTCKRFAQNEIGLIEEALLLVVSLEWLRSGVDPTVNTFSTPHIRYAQDSLYDMYIHATMQEEKSRSGLVETEQKDLSNSRARKLECAYRSARALLYLIESETGTDNQLIHNVSELAVSCADDIATFGNSVHRFGLSFLEFLVCWSGFHQRPWPFCIMPKARNITQKAKCCIDNAFKEWGRPKPRVERWILDIGMANAEGTSATGGIVSEAEQLYRNPLKGLEDEAICNVIGAHLSKILKCLCLSGLSEIALHSVDVDYPPSEDLTQTNLNLIHDLSCGELPSSLYFWRSGKAVTASVRFLLASARQLVAESLLRRGLLSDAQTFLDDAVRDAPADPNALFSLGAFYLRMMLFSNDLDTGKYAKAAQIQLLKAAKADSSKASPFALLGYWYEGFNDEKRSIGCYSKAILLDPTHPVAGRGLLRLKSRDSLQNILVAATERNSPSNGWAWSAVGVEKSMTEGNDNFAVIAFLKALRSRDVQNPKSEGQSYFFSDPLTPKPPGACELVHISSELASCYRRLGRLTSSLRSYRSAIEAAAGSVSSSVLCSCAQGKDTFRRYAFTC